MSEPTLKSKMFVQALVRQCQSHDVFAAVVAKGDEDAGAVLVKLNMFQNGCVVLTQVRTNDGERAWMRGTGPEPVSEREADAYVERQRKYDLDLWVIEIEDRDGRHPLADKII